MSTTDAIQWENLELQFAMRKCDARLPVLLALQCKVAEHVEHYIMEFIDVGDMVALHLASQFYRQSVIRYLKQAKHVALLRDLYGMIHARRTALVLMTTHCMQIRTLYLNSSTDDNDIAIDDSEGDSGGDDKVDHFGWYDAFLYSQLLQIMANNANTLEKLYFSKYLVFQNHKRWKKLYGLLLSCPCLKSMSWSFRFFQFMDAAIASNDDNTEEEKQRKEKSLMTCSSASCSSSTFSSLLRAHSSLERLMFSFGPLWTMEKCVRATEVIASLCTTGLPALRALSVKMHVRKSHSLMNYFITSPVVHYLTRLRLILDCFEVTPSSSSSSCLSPLIITWDMECARQMTELIISECLTNQINVLIIAPSIVDLSVHSRFVTVVAPKTTRLKMVDNAAPSQWKQTLNNMPALTDFYVGKCTNVSASLQQTWDREQSDVMVWLLPLAEQCVANKQSIFPKLEKISTRFSRPLPFAFFQCVVCFAHHLVSVSIKCSRWTLSSTVALMESNGSTLEYLDIITIIDNSSASLAASLAESSYEQKKEEEEESTKQEMAKQITGTLPVACEEEVSPAKPIYLPRLNYLRIDVASLSFFNKLYAPYLHRVRFFLSFFFFFFCFFRFFFFSEPQTQDPQPILRV